MTRATFRNICLLSISCFFIFVSGSIVWAATAPTILSSSKIIESGNCQILINGLVTPGNNVQIFINGKYDGLANISQITSDYSRFSYLSNPYSSNQKFEVMAIGENISSKELSAPAISQVNSTIEKSSFNTAPKIIPASEKNSATLTPPTLISPTGSVCVFTPYISGITLSHTSVLVYIDNKLATTLPTNNSSSTNFIFSYSSNLVLGRGTHSVYVVAENAAGVKSLKSSTVNFCISSPEISSAISTTSTENNLNATTTTATSSINETSTVVFQKTNKLPMSEKDKNILDIIIFLLFIIGLLIWMIFVNRELSQENKETDKNIKK
jgi:hypothetical protein